LKLEKKTMSSERLQNLLQLTVAFDSCRSGGLIGGHDKIGTSYFPRHSRAYSYLQHRLEGHEVGLLLSACQTREFARQDIPSTGIGVVFTSLMIETLFNFYGNITNRNLIREVSECMSRVPCTTNPHTGEIRDFYVGDFQHPGLYGTHEQTDRLFLRGPASTPSPPSGLDPWDD
jgi:hypothetical protein